MGEMAEYYRDHNLSRMDFEVWQQDRCQKRITWTTNDGRVLEPNEMSDDHLLNSLHLCERRRDEVILNFAPTYRAMVLELVKRGKLAESYFKLSVDARLNVRFDDWEQFE